MLLALMAMLATPFAIAIFAKRANGRYVNNPEERAAFTICVVVVGCYAWHVASRLLRHIRGQSNAEL